jgi:hypothetical protein
VPATSPTASSASKTAAARRLPTNARREAAAVARIIMEARKGAVVVVGTVKEEKGVTKALKRGSTLRNAGAEGDKITLIMQ